MKYFLSNCNLFWCINIWNTLYIYEVRSKSNEKMLGGALFIIRKSSNLVTFEIRAFCTYTLAQAFLAPLKDLLPVLVLHYLKALFRFPLNLLFGSPSCCLSCEARRKCHREAGLDWRLSFVPVLSPYRPYKGQPA